MKIEFNVGQIVRVNSGFNGGRTEPMVGIVTEVDYAYVWQPCIEVTEQFKDGSGGISVWVYPLPDEREFNVEILSEPAQTTQP